jgi:hypothetical protein
MTDNTKRNKRSLLPLLGQTIGWVAGLATEGDVEKILHEVDYLTAKNEKLINISDRSISLVSGLERELRMEKN